MSMPRPRSACCCSRTATRPSGLNWLKKAADQGEPRALLVYGTALFNGDGVTQDPVLRLRLCQPRRRAGARSGQADARAARPAPAARGPQAGRSPWRERQARKTTPRRPGSQAGETARSSATEAAVVATAKARRRRSRRHLRKHNADQPPQTPRAGKRRLANPARRVFASAARPKRSIRSCRAKPPLPGGSLSTSPPGPSPGFRSDRSKAEPAAEVGVQRRSGTALLPGRRQIV